MQIIILRTGVTEKEGIFGGGYAKFWGGDTKITCEQQNCAGRLFHGIVAIRHGSGFTVFLDTHA